MKETEIKRLWRGFWQIADPKIWIASTVPMAVGGALAYGITGKFSVYWFIVSLVGIYLIEIGKNAVNEVVDYKSGVDRYVSPEKRTPFSGGKKSIIDGKLTVFEAGVVALLTMGAACLIGFYIILFKEFSVFWIGITGVLISVFYSIPPFKLAYRGLGEVTVGITFGPLILCGIYLVMTGSIDLRAIVVSIPIGLLIANVLWINQYPDYEADLQGGKMNWVVRLGKKKALKIYKLLFILAYAFFPLISIILRNWSWLLGFSTVPLALQAVKTAQIYYNDIPRLIKANARTVQVYLLTGVIMVIAALMSR